MILDRSKIDTKNVSDGYHTFGELYYHRTVLFSVLCKVFKDRSYIANKHNDGTMYDNMFLAVINTPEGQYSYHCNNKYRYLFDGIEEREYSEVYDGHKPEDVERLISLL